MKRSLYTAAFASIMLLASATAHADIIANTGTLGPNDPFWSVAWHGLIPSGTSFGYQAQAPLVTAIPSPPWQPNTVGNNWIGVNASASIPGAPGDGSHRYEYA